MGLDRGALPGGAVFLGVPEGGIDEEEGVGGAEVEESGAVGATGKGTARIIANRFTLACFSDASVEISGKEHEGGGGVGAVGVGEGCVEVAAVVVGGGVGRRVDVQNDKASGWGKANLKGGDAVGEALQAVRGTDEGLVNCEAEAEVGLGGGQQVKGVVVDDLVKGVGQFGFLDSADVDVAVGEVGSELVAFEWVGEAADVECC